MPKIVSPAFIRSLVMTHMSSGAAAAVSPDFTGTGALTIAATPTGGLGFRGHIERFKFRVGPADFAGAAGTQTFKLRKGGATGTVLATLTIPLASALRGATLEALVAAADDTASRFVDTDQLTITRDAGGTAFTGGEGVFEVVVRQPPQAKL